MEVHTRIRLVPFHSTYVSCSTGNSINTAFSAVATSIQAYAFQVTFANTTPGTVAMHIGVSAPTITTTDQVYCFSEAANVVDATGRQYILSPGQSVYLRCVNTSIVSNIAVVQFQTQ